MPLRKRHLLVAIYLLLSVLTLLVCNTTAGLASRLAGSLALAAATVLSALTQVTSLKSLNSFHNRTPFSSNYYFGAAFVVENTAA